MPKISTRFNISILINIGQLVGLAIPLIVSENFEAILRVFDDIFYGRILIPNDEYNLSN